MRTLLLTLALATGLGTMAQSTTDRATAAEAERKAVTERADARTAELTQQLDLTPEQSTKVHDITLRHFQSMRGVERMPAGPARDNRERLLNEKRDNAYQAVLTPEQYAKLAGTKSDAKKPHNE